MGLYVHASESLADALEGVARFLGRGLQEPQTVTLTWAQWICAPAVFFKM